MDPRDLELLRRIRDGERVFRQREGQSYDQYEEEVQRLLRLRDNGMITMHPEPMRSSMSARREYLLTGNCELTLKGREALERFTR
jgi:hypothetical protein